MEETVLMVLIIVHVIVLALDIVETCVNMVSITTENTQAVTINDKSMMLSTDVLYHI